MVRRNPLRLLAVVEHAAPNERRGWGGGELSATLPSRACEPSKIG